jgi:hypothetical protein
MSMSRAFVFVVMPLALACSSDLRSKTRAFVADTPCGQGPYDIHIAADGKTGEEGVEVIACTARQLKGVAEVRIGGMPMYTRAFGEDGIADNGRCLAGPATVATTSMSSSTASSATPTHGTDAVTRAPALIEQPFRGKETRFSDQLCEAYGLQAQTIVGAVLTRTSPGDELHVRIWSDVPNDLEHTIFLVQQLTSKKTKEQVDKEWDKLAAKQAKNPPAESAPAESTPAPTHEPEHGPPPAPLAEVRPLQPTTNATWIAGYWQWTGTTWGWVAGFWRDERLAMPAPRVEVPGAMPSASAVWIGGVWQLRGGAWIWVEGRWRR